MFELFNDCKKSYIYSNSIDFRETVSQSKINRVKIPVELNNASTKRKREFLLGRVCAAEGLKKLGHYESATIQIAADRSPVWPQGITGSITHSNKAVSVVLGKTDKIRSIGIDSEEIITSETLNTISSYVLTNTELELYHKHYKNQFSLESFVTILFSAKESIYKCYYPSVKHFFDFQDVMITHLDRDFNIFIFSVLNKLSSEFKRGYTNYGNFYLQDNVVNTMVQLS